MTEKAKQKAEELKYYYYNLLEPFIQDKEFLESKAIQCALICVEQQFELAKTLPDEIGLPLTIELLQVKQHLEEM